MGYERVLADLKEQFRGRLLLSPEDIAPLISVSAKAQANQRSRGTFPIPLVPQPPLSRKVRISIYALATYLAGEDCDAGRSGGKGKSRSDPARAEESESASQGKKRRGRKRKTVEKTEDGAGKRKASEKPYHPRRPPIGPA